MSPPVQHGFLQTWAHCDLTCRVWPKRFNGVAFTGGMRFASDVTLERGLTRLLLGSCMVEKKKKGKENVKVNYEDNITLPYSCVPPPRGAGCTPICGMQTVPRFTPAVQRWPGLGARERAMAQGCQQKQPLGDRKWAGICSIPLTLNICQLLIRKPPLSRIILLHPSCREKLPQISHPMTLSGSCLLMLLVSSFKKPLPHLAWSCSPNFFYAMAFLKHKEYFLVH